MCVCVCVYQCTYSSDVPSQSTEKGHYCSPKHPLDTRHGRGLQKEGTLSLSQGAQGVSERAEGVRGKQ